MDLPLTVLFADNDLVVVDKPSGLPTVPAPDAPPGGCVRSVLERQLGSPVWVVHRLDRDTSGVLLFARTADAHRGLCQAFEERRIRKAYAAFTLGVPAGRDGRITTPLHPARRGMERADRLPHVPRGRLFSDPAKSVPSEVSFFLFFKHKGTQRQRR